LFADVEDDLEMMNDLDDTDVDYQESREEIMAKSLVYLVRSKLISVFKKRY